MKKSTIIYAALLILGMASMANAETNCPPQGHHTYMKHQKHHKAHSMHKMHGRIDASYQN
jgi:hypothetical protein